jgi:DNA-binding MarR family transcriptional regulator
MSTQRLNEPWKTPAKSGACACAQLRRTARRISSFYDAILKPARLTNTQYSLLVTIGRSGQISRTALADRLGMDGLVDSMKSEDRRERLLTLSPAGTQRLRQSYVLWEEAQRAVTKTIGKDNLEQLRNALSSAEQAIELANKRRQK